MLQGYIGVAAVDGEHQVIVEAQAHGTPHEHDLLKPVIDGVRDHLAAIGVAGAAGGAAFLADAGYHSERGLETLAVAARLELTRKAGSILPPGSAR